ncbi:MAG: glycosyltransferase [Bacteroidales bacterium]|nr:glycosyltransferase [Bacteroidales bacterium]
MLYDNKISFSPKIHIAIPAMNEEAYINNCLEAIAVQTYSNYEVYLCINQPNDWWENKEKIDVCLSNQRLLHLLKNSPHHVIDKSSQGKGWDSKNHGVGWARKTLMDFINRRADAEDIIVSLDADTIFGENYLASVISMFKNHPAGLALSNPYYHRLSGNEILDRAMLRYEIYMRAYAINLMHIQSPYAFTALGSAIAIPVSVYRKSGGLTPKKSGEDFYFLQKIRKSGPLLCWNTEKVFPATRFSDRVFFGTGPALIKGSKGNWDSYPIYHRKLFEAIRSTYELFPELYLRNCETPLSAFICEQLREPDIWEKLRKNSKSQETFVAACHQKIDGLRILQYLKWKNNILKINDEESLCDFFDFFYKNEVQTDLSGFDFKTTSITVLDNIRNVMADKESEMQKEGLLKIRV